MDLDTGTPARARLVEGLLGWGAPRPLAPPGLATRLLHQLETGLAELGPEVADVASSRRRGTLLISKSGLDRLACDGWQLEPVPYTQSTANARGTLAHEAIAVDWSMRRTEPPAAVAAAVWDEVASRRPGDPASLSAWMNARPPEEAAELRDDIAGLVATFREVWPPVPATVVRARVERPVEVRLAGGAVTLRGVPDLVLDSPREDERARALVVDLKTGRPRADHDRHELRFYALLVTLATGKPPFRWGTFYVTEGRAEAEDLREDALSVTVRRVLDGVRQAVRLHGHDPAADDEGLRIVGGSWCRFCLREPTCEVAASAVHARPR